MHACMHTYMLTHMIRRTRRWPCWNWGVSLRKRPTSRVSTELTALNRAATAMCIGGGPSPQWTRPGRQVLAHPPAPVRSTGPLSRLHLACSSGARIVIGITMGARPSSPVKKNVEPTAHVMSHRHSSVPDRARSYAATGDATFPNEEQYLQELASDSFPTRGTLLDARESAPVRFLNRSLSAGTGTR